MSMTWGYRPLRPPPSTAMRDGSLCSRRSRGSTPSTIGPLAAGLLRSALGQEWPWVTVDLCVADPWLRDVVPGELIHYQARLNEGEDGSRDKIRQDRSSFEPSPDSGRSIDQ